MKDLVSYVVKNLVDSPEKIQIRENGNGSKIEISVLVDKADRGKIIGRKGCVIKALRLVANAAAAKQNRRVSIELVE